MTISKDIQTELSQLQPYIDRYLELCRVLGMDSANYNRLMSIPATAKLLGVARETIDLWLLDPGFPRILVGNSHQVRLRQGDVFAYLKDKATHWYEEIPGNDWGDE